MNHREYRAKVLQARATGSPVFLTESELRWLRDYMLQFSEALQELPEISAEDRYDFGQAVSIGIKCANILAQID